MDFRRLFNGFGYFSLSFLVKIIKLLKGGESFIVSYKTTYYSNNCPNIETFNFMTGMINFVNKRITFIPRSLSKFDKKKVR